MNWMRSTTCLFDFQCNVPQQHHITRESMEKILEKLRIILAKTSISNCVLDCTQMVGKHVVPKASFLGTDKLEPQSVDRHQFCQPTLNFFFAFDNCSSETPTLSISP